MMLNKDRDFEVYQLHGSIDERNTQSLRIHGDIVPWAERHAISCVTWFGQAAQAKQHTDKQTDRVRERKKRREQIGYNIKCIADGIY